jgi:hypothetical protein
MPACCFWSVILSMILFLSFVFVFVSSFWKCVT